MIVVVVIAFVMLVSFWLWEQYGGSEVGGTPVPGCKVDSDCVVFGETGDCNCGCYERGNLPSGTGGECFCLAPTSCQCVEGECEGVFKDD